MNAHLKTLVVVAAALLVGCGSPADQLGAPATRGPEDAPWPPITFPATTAAEPIGAGDVTVAMRAESGFRPWQIVRQNVEFGSELVPGVALRNDAGVLLQAFIGQRDGSEQFRPGFTLRGELGVPLASVPISDTAYVSLSIQGDRDAVKAAMASVDPEAIGTSGVSDLDSLSTSFGGEWVEVARVGEGAPNPFGASWSIRYTDGNDGYLTAIAYAPADQPISIDQASLVFTSEDLIKIDGTEVLYSQGGAGATPSVWFVHPSGYLVVVGFDEKDRDDLPRWFDEFTVQPVSELEASLVTP